MRQFDMNKTKETLDRLLNQAKESVKVLETLQKEGMDRARTILQTQIPSADEAQKIANEKVKKTLKKLGFASRSEVRDLEQKVEELAAELRAQIAKVSRKNKGAKGEPEANA
jgi:hypothetical protein